MSVRIINGDMLRVLPDMEAQMFHACITDPPYHLSSVVKRFGADNSAPVKPGVSGVYARSSAGFMGVKWDGGQAAFEPGTWSQVYRVLKPGAFLVAFASTRGYHRMVCAIEDAGFVIHPMLAWITGQGFPKATRFNQPELDGWRYGLQALKPAVEPICLAQKPLAGTGSQNWAKHGCGGLNIDASRIPASEDHAANCTRSNVKGHWGAAGRAEVTASPLGRWPANVIHDGSPEVEEAFARFGERTSGAPGIKHGGNNGAAYGAESRPPGMQMGGFGDTGSASRFFYSCKADASERISRNVEEVEIEWTSETGQCQARLQADTGQSPPKAIVVSGSGDALEWSTFLSGSTITDLCRRASKSTIAMGRSSTTASTTWNSLIRSLTSGCTAVASCEPEDGGSRAASVGPNILSATIILSETVFFPGASRAVSGTPLIISVSAKKHGHPTVKPTSLMSWLVKLVCPPGGLVLDPFAGTGSTGLAADRLGMDAILIERDPQYAADAERKIKQDAPLFADVQQPELDAVRQPELFTEAAD